MCWNKSVSITTFAFGLCVLIIVFINNKYNSSKIDFFTNPYAYFFVFSIIFMQFVEFLLWRNIKNTIINSNLSKLGLLTLSIQPLASVLLITDSTLRNYVLLIYSIPALIYFIYTITTSRIHTTMSPSGHLVWDWSNITGIWYKLIILSYLFFLIFPLIYNRYYFALVFLFLFVLLKIYYNDGSASSLWCFYVNSLMLYFLLGVLFILPYNSVILK